MRLNSDEADYNTSSSRFSWLKEDFHRIIFRIKRFKWADLKKTKFILSIITTLFAITGLTLFIHSIAVLSRWQAYETFLTDSIFLVPRFVLATSIFILLIALFGFYGVKSRKYKFILAYTVLLVPILVFEIALTTVAFNTLYDARRGIGNYMYINNPYLYPNVQNRRDLTAIWDNMQRELQCCDLHSNWNNKKTMKLPISCCSIPNGTMSPFECTSKNSHRFPCDLAVASFVTTDLYTIGVMGAVFTCLQGIILGLATWMVRRLKKKPFNETNRDSQKIVAPNPRVIDYSRY